ncbi:capsular biosynthesis protein [Hahella sp. CCB-MM4]|uniref:polysaccharide biosynthesis/export family protein n=1 Tax=Hahella sp. (strain CCB-MM4) TaxID=1926491 RepID=UPI000B9C4FC5|nr:polysaccharide biosynthesis/export family protein [Hahella sp. CCB-MM4]OZG75468.1 capsular biosynthesis protein [Hahella sp. CCB-MM4]
MSVVSNSHAEEPVSAIEQYKLGPGDLIRIQVYGENDLTLEARLGEADSIDYPFLGEIKPVGKTLDQMQAQIAQGLKQGYLVDPRVSVTVLEYRQFYISGEVKNPGGYAYQPGLTVRTAISLAGGFTDDAAEDEIQLISENDPAKTPHPASQDVRLKPGDTIIVKESFF